MLTGYETLNNYERRILYLDCHLCKDNSDQMINFAISLTKTRHKLEALSILFKLKSLQK
jgi:hypothetical protein